MKTSEIQSIQTIFNQYRQIVILPHILPDGDTIGSAAALAHMLKVAGKQVTVLVEDEIPSNLSSISKEHFVSLEQFEEPQSPYGVIAVDASDIGRLGRRVSRLSGRSVLGVIDHHRTNTRYGDANLVEPEACSTGEIIYGLAHASGLVVDHVAATALYVAISTDTGSFRYSNTTARCMQIAAELIETGIPAAAINVDLYQNQPMNKIKLLMDALNSMELLHDDSVALVSVTQDMMERYNAQYEDTDGITEYVRGIQGIEVVVLFKELGPAQIKVSTRSKHWFDVSELCLAFGGGGHRRAAGCSFSTGLEEAKAAVRKNIMEKMSHERNS